MARKEALRITLHGQSEFEARDVTLAGDLSFDVPDGWRMTVTAGTAGSGWQTSMEPLAGSGRQPSWQWRYSQRPDGSIHLRMDEHAPAEVVLANSSWWTARGGPLTSHGSTVGSVGSLGSSGSTVMMEPWWAATSAEPLDHSWLSSQL